MKIEGMCALVIGGAGGIGRALVQRLLSKAAKFVAIVDVDKPAGEETEEKFCAEFGKEKVRFIQCDVLIEKELERAFQDAYDIHGKLDLVVNNAGVLVGPKVLQINLISLTPKEEIPIQQYILAAILNFCIQQKCSIVTNWHPPDLESEAVIRSAYLAKKYMSKKNGGQGGLLINMASITSFIPFLDPVYAASKHGVKGFSLALTTCDPSFTQDDIRVAVMCPTGVDNSFLDVNSETRMLKASVNLVSESEVVDAYMMVIEDDAKHGCCVCITAANGVELLPMKTVREWETDLKIFKS